MTSKVKVAGALPQFGKDVSPLPDSRLELQRTPSFTSWTRAFLVSRFADLSSLWLDFKMPSVPMNGDLYLGL